MFSCGFEKVSAVQQVDLDKTAGFASKIMGGLLAGSMAMPAAAKSVGKPITQAVKPAAVATMKATGAMKPAATASMKATGATKSSVFAPRFAAHDSTPPIGFYQDKTLYRPKKPVTPEYGRAWGDLARYTGRNHPDFQGQTRIWSHKDAYNAVMKNLDAGKPAITPDMLR